jgi:hypothetical protein
MITHSWCPMAQNVDIFGHNGATVSLTVRLTEPLTYTLYLTRACLTRSARTPLQYSK